MRDGGEDNGRLHYTANLQDVNHPHAIDGDMVVPGLWYVDSNTWYSFVGNSFDLLGVTRNNISNGDLFIDGVLVGTADFAYPYSEQPFSFHYSGLADGPHVVRINNNASLRVDAFQSNPAQPTPYLPVAEWWDNAPRGGSGAFGTPAGMLMGIAAGDLDGDGEIEIVAPSDTYTENGGAFMNAIFIYRGDGEDAGNGSPLIRRIDFPAQGDQLGREHIGSVALADLDGQPGSEIIIGSERGMYAFFNTGVTYWFTDTFHGPHNATVVTPAVGNLDLDAAPEIVVNMSNNLVVYTAAGDIAWSATLPAEVGMPLLADMTGDGLLDIVAYDANGGVRLYDYNLGAPQLLWQTTLSSAIGTVRGGPAIVDVDGDGSPEIAISHDGYHTALDAAGNVVWSTQLDPGAPGGVSVADIDGDGEIEIVTGMRYDDGIGIGKLYALNADGSILWQRPAYDDTSANSQSVLDLNGDGVYEIAWNGAQYGFTIFNGADGEILFNEPLAESLTGTDYPIFADVDVDGYAEIVAPTNGGIAVFGQDGAWGESRTVWNQHSYHITNVNIDLTIPAVEADSWTVHNTYRTQWPQDIVVPVYDVTVTHTVGLADVAVLTDTFSSPPTVSHDSVYGWHYTQLGTQPVITRTFDSMLTNLEPGETQLVAQETAVSYIFPSGANQITLPPLYADCGASGRTDAARTKHSGRRHGRLQPHPHQSRQQRRYVCSGGQRGAVCLVELSGQRALERR
ncbi:MAG: FG-GAP-like repeat-containing protein [Chloroflexi bacterium]|nr:FG-GAP-like repeat-containing protein [Chloroflexota bacterium]